MPNVDVVLIYPYFHREGWWRKLWLFPPLGLGYLAATLRQEGISVALLDGTFTTPEALVEKARSLRPRIIGIYAMVTLREDALRLARSLKGGSLLVAGGPFPTSQPESFLPPFDLVVLGEGEETFQEVAKRYLEGEEIQGIAGTVTREERNPTRPYIEDLDRIPFPARDLHENDRYQAYWKRTFGHRCAPLLTTRGCPYRCDFCARPVFGNRYRERSAGNVVSEIEEVLRLGYDRIWFSDDVFTLNEGRVLEICDRIRDRRLHFSWECLCRVDRVSEEMLGKMKGAGCDRVFFGIESGDDEVLKRMEKRITVAQAERAVRLAKEAGLRVGTFFMVGYPGETNETILRTLRFSSSLPTDYLSYTLPYPLPGTPLYQRLERRLTRDEWKMAGHNLLMFEGDFSQRKLRFAIYKGTIQHRLRRHGLPLAARLFEKATDPIFVRLR
jgi:anaerobic magnesium-protoporphyrin IX monomethyl ester cyclase